MALSCRTAACLLVVVLLQGVVLTLAAVPNLSDAQRIEDADVIAVGILTSLHTDQVEQREGFVNGVAQAKFAATTFEKGDSLETVTYWYPIERPAGWVGHQGQSSEPPTNTLVKVFTTADGELLTPNGWELVEEEVAEAEEPEVEETPVEEEVSEETTAAAASTDDDDATAEDEVSSSSTEEEAAPEEEVVEDEVIVVEEEDEPPVSTESETRVVESRALAILKPWRALVQRIARWFAAVRARFRK